MSYLVTSVMDLLIKVGQFYDQLLTPKNDALITSYRARTDLLNLDGDYVVILDWVD